MQGFKQRSDTVFGTLERVLGMSCVEKRPWVERVPARLGERRELVRRLRSDPGGRRRAGGRAWTW